MTENIPTEKLDFNSDCHSSMTPNLVNQMKNQSYTSNDVDIVNQDTIPSEMTDKELIKAGWPWNGKIVFNDVYLRYRAGFETVLNGVSLEVSSGESLGIVGRTGSGKSSLFRILLRLNEFEKGQILIDGVDISKIGLDTLRSCISIIPQDAVLFSGSVR
jgi:ABC-type multidrug transport system fused ATPase/permease subunit